ncbi:hypothetical protein CGRA01v4_09733 [Colletotrichum graminicola]|nr:hypothetical protein CGRA01v4_09733 [Colletotrichum graminicola]
MCRLCPRPGCSVIPPRIVQPAPSYDGASAFAAYQVFKDTPEDLEAAVRPLRPPFGIVIYDMMHTARPTLSARLTRTVFDRTCRYHRHRNYRPDRVEVVTPPLLQSSTDVEHVDACICHHDEEIQSRTLILNEAEPVSWFLPRRDLNGSYARRILAINRLEGYSSDDEVEVALGKEPLSNKEDALEHAALKNSEASRSGSFLGIDWQPRKELWSLYNGRNYDPDMEMRR